MLRTFYSDYVLRYPRTVIFLIVVAILFFGYQATKLEVDASAETLVLEDDKDLRYTRQVNSRFRSPDFLVVTYTPKEYLLSEKTLATIRALQGDLAKVRGVESVLSILNVPLLASPPKPLKELLKDVPTLESPGIDKELARKEFLSSPIYSNALVSADFKTTALQVNLLEDRIFQEFVNRRYALREKERDGALTPAESTELEKIQLDLKAHRDRVRIEQHENILQVRRVMDKYRGGGGELFLGGITMIADDLITFVKSDLQVFGIGVLIFLIITLWVIFRQLRWILIPVLTCVFSVIATAGLLGLFGWEVTVISSNFVSLQLIVTMAMTIHLIVRYREIVAQRPNASQRELVLESVLSMAKPCAFMVLTTIAGFSSLLLSGILPVINFGWMMSAGIAVTLFLTFLIFPAVLVQLERVPPNTSFEARFALTKKLAQFTENHGKAILVTSSIVMVLSVAGAAQLKVENSFIDFFKESTEIYQGMKVIDEQLGGTTPLDIVLDFGNSQGDAESSAPAAGAPSAQVATAPDAKVIAKQDTNGEDEGEEDDEEFDEFEEEFEAAKGEAQYWFTADRMATVARIHDYLETIPEVGKVVSLGTMLKVGATLNDGDPLDNFALALVYNELPEKFRKIILDPYVSIEHNQARFSIRVRDSDPNLRRNELLERIRRELRDEVGLEEGSFHLAGLLLLYNNMLQSLFNSQILTLGAVVVALMLMFMVLFRSIKIAAVAILPNVLSVGVVLGLMGWAGIPLDLMTITIAAISVGIAVDDTIHYIYRFMEEFPKDRNYLTTMHRCHATIGYAMYYTSITIIIGFSILALSNFIPSIYFGLLTSLAMVVALVAALTLLPQLIIFVKPFGPEGRVEA